MTGGHIIKERPLTAGHKREEQMETTWDLPETLLDNKSDFNNDFYNRFNLRKGDNPILMDEGIKKDYLFPTFYGDVTCAMGIFFCSYKKTAQLIKEKLGSQVKPVKMGKGRALVAFSNYEYKKILGVRPYNEIAVAIPIMVNPGFINPPVLPMVMDSFSRFGYYIAAMPVTSNENTQRGHKIWGLPKVTQPIDIYREKEDCITVAKESNGEEYLKIRVPMKGKAEKFDVTGNLYSRLNNELKQSETNFTGTFNINKNMNLLFKKGVIPEKPFIEIGDSQSGKLLKNLEIEPYPFQLRYAENVSSCFDLPQKDVPSWVKSVN